MNVTSDKKVEIFKKVIQCLTKHYEFVNMGTHYNYLAANRKMREVNI